MEGVMYWSCESPFHMLCIEADQTNRRSWDDVLTRIEEKSAEMRVEGALAEGDLALTPLAIVVQDAPPHVVKAVLDASPSAAGVPDRYGELPIHRAALNHRRNLEVSETDESASVCAILRQAKPESLVITDKYGRTPLHCAIASHKTRKGAASLGCMAELIGDGSPLRVEDKAGKTPLQAATSGNLPESVIALLEKRS